jgi:nicotinamide-nucleotide amidase
MRLCNMFTPELLKSAEIILQSARARGLKITTAESCTGGLISALLTEISGSSDAFTHGFTTYANAAKIEMIGVDAALIKTHGAVSEEVARAMAEGALRTADADISVAVTGIAGPGGATANKPMGLVHIASARKDFSTLHTQCIFLGNRSEVRLQAVAAALELVQQQFCR